MMPISERAEEICTEWFPQLSHKSERYEAARQFFSEQLAAELEHVFRTGYSRGYNDCIREDLALPRSCNPEPVAVS